MAKKWPTANRTFFVFFRRAPFIGRWNWLDCSIWCGRPSFSPHIITQYEVFHLDKYSLSKSTKIHFHQFWHTVLTFWRQAIPTLSAIPARAFIVLIFALQSVRKLHKWPLPNAQGFPPSNFNMLNDTSNHAKYDVNLANPLSHIPFYPSLSPHYPHINDLPSFFTLIIFF